MRRAALIVCGVLLAGCPVARANHPEFTSYAELQALVADWAKRGAEVEVASKSQEGRDIYMVRVGSVPITLLLINELHATEPSGTESFVRLVELLLGAPAPTFAADRLPGVRPDAPLFQALADSQLRAELLRRVTIVGFPMLD